MPITNVDQSTKIVLGAFDDLVSTPTLDESQLSELPRFIDLSDDMTPAKNQSDRGVCTVFTSIGIIEAAIKKDLGTEVNLSEEYMNYISKQHGRYEFTEGSVFLENILAMYSDGLLLEEDWSYQASWFNKDFPCANYKPTDKTAPKICFSHNKPNSQALDRIFDGNNIKFNFLKKNTNEIIKFLAIIKRPLVMSVNINFDGWPSSGVTNYNEDLREDCVKNPSKCGGHSVILSGYDMEKRVFMFKNSWGKKWGKNGYGTIPFDVVDKYTGELFYYAKVMGELNIPKSQDTKLNLIKFDVSASIKDDKSITIDIDGEIEETTGKMLFVSSDMVKKHKRFSKEFPSFVNTELVRIYDLDDQRIFGDTYIRVTTHTIPQEENTIFFRPDGDLKLSFSSKALSIPSIDSLISSTYYELALRTTLYVHSDEDGFVKLKEVYSPIF